MKVAIALFVKDEAPEIIWWISWHQSIGVSRFLIYDDNSSDGTAEIIKGLSKADPSITLHSTGTANHFAQRQAFAYVDAIGVAQRESLSWLGFLDCDEYLDLGPYDTVETMLSNIPGFAALALNWRCYGANGHHIFPGPNALDCYKSFITIGRGENFAVKSFVRPQATQKIYRNPHVFQVSGAYADCQGETLPDTGFLHRPAEGDVPFIRHYITRSLEHFLEKLKKREDLLANKHALDFFTKFQEECRSPDFTRYKPEFPRHVHRAISHLHVQYLSESFSHGSDQIEIALYDMSMLRTCKIILPNDRDLYYDKKTGEVFCAEKHRYGADKGRVICYTNPLDQDHIYFAPENPDDFLNIKFDSQYSSMIAMNLHRSSNGKFHMRSATNTFVVSFTRGQDTSGRLEANRASVREWEEFEIAHPGQSDIAARPVCVGPETAAVAYANIESAFHFADLFACWSLVTRFSHARPEVKKILSFYKV